MYSMLAHALLVHALLGHIDAIDSVLAGDSNLLGVMHCTQPQMQAFEIPCHTMCNHLRRVFCWVLN